MNKLSDHSILTLKAFAIFGVVFHHLGNRRFDSDILLSINLLPQMFTWSVLAFIAISGWLHGSSEARKSKSFFEFFCAKSRRLLGPYLALVFLYATIWEIIQFFGVAGVATRIPDGFLEKIYFTVSGLEPVAEQLYFLPLLFVISLVGHASVRGLSSYGIPIICLLSLLGGVVIAPKCSNTGFSIGMLFFGLFSYSGGYLLFVYRAYRVRWLALAAVSIIVFCGIGGTGLPKVFPLLILAGMPWLSFMNTRFFDWIGEASGTIYAYHTPFILQPMVIFCTTLDKSFQIASAMAAAFVSIFICAIFHHLLEKGRGRFVLM